MIVYIEGVDGSGKSTFATAITKFLQDKGFDVHPKAEKAMVTHPWRLDRTNREDLLFNLRARLNSPSIYIVDRGELSDIIYRTFDLEKYTALMSLDEYYHFYKLYERKYIIVHCDTNLSEKLMLERGEDNKISITEHQKLRYLFNQIMPLFQAIKYDASLSMAIPSYLDAVCAGIRMELILRGATDNG